MKTVTSPTKLCSRCHAAFPRSVEFFHRNKTTADGLAPRCKQCVKEYSRQWYLKNKEKMRETVKKWRKDNPDKAREYGRASALRNRESHNASWRNHEARKKQNGGCHTAEDVKKIFDLQKGRCWWCGKKVNKKSYHVDHRVPLAKGGSNSPSNLVISCPHCNLVKHDKMPDEFNGRLL